MKIKFNSDDNFPLNKILKPYNLTTVARFFKKTTSIIPKIFG